MFSRISGGLILLPFAIFWIGIVGTFDAMAFREAVRAVRSFNYSSVDGKVISSKVEEGTDSDGDRTYTPKIVYQYSVGGAPFQNDRLQYGTPLGGSGKAHQIVSTHPVQSLVTVYYDPANPGESALHRGTNGSELFLIMFLTPFNLIGLALVVALVQGPAKGVGGVLVDESPRELRAHLNPVHPFSQLLASLGGATFAGTFVVGFGQFVIPVFPLSAATWALIMWFCGKQYLEARKEQQQCKGDLVYLPLARRLEFWPLGAQALERIPVNQISCIKVTTQVTTDSAGDATTDYILGLKLANGHSYELRKWKSESDAATFMDWLRARLPIEMETEAEDETEPEVEEGWTSS